MSRSFFHPDNALMITMAQITDCIFLSLFWLLGSMPLVTAGAAAAALYDAVWHGFRRGDKNCWSRFFHAFRQNFRPSLAPTLVFWGGVMLIWRTGIFFWNGAAEGRLSWALFAAAALVLTVVTGIGSILFPMLSRFENPTLRLLGNTLRLGLGHLPRTMALGILYAAAAFLCVRYVFPLFFLPGLAALLSTLLIEPMFRPFLPDGGQ